MQLDGGIDKHIVRLLYQRNTAYYMQLFRSIKESYKKISLDAFNSHVKRLVIAGLIDKDDTGTRGKRVYYYLTDKAKQLERLKILQLKSPEEKALFEKEGREEKHRKMYILLFLFIEYLRPWSPNRLTEQEVDTLLDRFESSRIHLVQERKWGYRILNEEYQERTEYKRVFDIKITKVENYNHGKLENTAYYCSLPGISIKDVHTLTSDLKPTFYHINFTQIELEEAFNLLIKEGILKPVMKFRDQWRYVVADESLSDLLSAYFYIFNKLNHIINMRWRYIRRPTIEELKWLEVFYGKEKTNEIRLFAYQERHSLSKNKRKRYARETREEIKKAREEINELMTEIEANYAQTIKKYNFPVEQLSELIYPPIFRHAMWNYWLKK